MSILIPDLCAKFHLNSLKNDCFTMIFVFFTLSLIGFGAQLIGPIQLHVKRQNSSICKFFQDIAWTFFLPVSGKICHSPIKKVKRQHTLIISFSQHSPFFEEQSKNPG